VADNVDDPLDSENLHASTVHFLLDGGEQEAAAALVECGLTAYPSGDHSWAGDEQVDAVAVVLEAPRSLYEILSASPSGHPLRDDQSRAITVRRAIKRATEACLPDGYYLKHFRVHAQHVRSSPGWREEVWRLLLEQGAASNQGRLGSDAPHSWHGLRFRSKSEVCVASALDAAGLLFFPNAACRVGRPLGRVTRECDFLVCVDRYWGVLEVDGEPFHPPSRAAEDHERDQMWLTEGVLVRRFPAERCWRDPTGVVRDFAAVMRSMHR
jgi:hypothetical protein